MGTAVGEPITRVFVGEGTQRENRSWHSYGRARRKKPEKKKEKGEVMNAAKKRAEGAFSARKEEIKPEKELDLKAFLAATPMGEGKVREKKEGGERLCGTFFVSVLRDLREALRR